MKGMFKIVTCYTHILIYNFLMGACTLTTDRVLYINWFSLGEAKIYTYNALALHYSLVRKKTCMSSDGPNPNISTTYITRSFFEFGARGPKAFATEKRFIKISNDDVSFFYSDFIYSCWKGKGSLDDSPYILHILFLKTHICTYYTERF